MPPAGRSVATFGGLLALGRQRFGNILATSWPRVGRAQATFGHGAATVALYMPLIFKEFFLVDHSDREFGALRWPKATAVCFHIAIFLDPRQSNSLKTEIAENGGA
jgi:hypothetical protein